MRKIYSAAAILLMGATFSYAQTIQDGLNFSFNDYQGTARTIGMGNAFTALGGDLGSIGINPAGSAINHYSQVTISPSISLSSVSAFYDPAPGLMGNNQPYNINTSRTKMALPNFGVVVNWNPTDASSSIKGISFGFVANTTANYNSHIVGRGINAETSILGEMSQYFTDSGFSYNDITHNNAYYNGFGWQDVVAARSGMVTTYGSGNDWIGATETIFPDGTVGTAGLLDQRWGRVTSGYKYDMVINLGMNFNDSFFIGGNLGMIALEYNQDTYHREIAQDPQDFLIEFDNGTACFDNLRLADWYKAEGAGVYAKLGFIYKTDVFSIGGAIQTPTIINIKETWQNYGDVAFTDNSRNASEYSPEGNFEYNFKTPMRFNVGAAFITPFGTLSADYEYTDFSQMRFRDNDNYDNATFDGINSDIKDLTGPVHMLRLGGEFNLNPAIALRAGYNLTTSPEYTYNAGSKEAVDAVRSAISLGAGYKSTGSFYCDFAVRRNMMPQQYITPYGNYINGINSPEISYKQKLWDIVMTFGWRF